MKKLSHILAVGSVGLLLGLLSESTFATQNRACINSAPPFGYVYIEDAEIDNLNQQPLDDLARARTEFQAQDYGMAAQDIQSAATLMKIQASVGVKGSRLAETAANLENLSRRVARNEVKTSADLDEELTRAAQAQAQHHYLHASQLWVKHMSKNAGNDMEAAVHATNRSLEWSGREISAGSAQVLSSSEALSAKLVAGGKWTAKEVGKGLSSLGKEISDLGKKLEAKTKTAIE